MLKFFINLSLFAAIAGTSWNDLYESGDLTEFLDAENKIHLFDKMKKNCELEQKNKWFPENCLKIWNQFLMDVDNKKSKSKKNYKNLEKMCKTRAHKIVEMEHLRSLLNLLLPGNCRQALEKRVGDLEYMQNRSFGSDI